MVDTRGIERSFRSFARATAAARSFTPRLA
jgi:hypothetical protein